MFHCLKLCRQSPLVTSVDAHSNLRPESLIDVLQEIFPTLRDVIMASTLTFEIA